MKGGCSSGSVTLRERQKYLLEHIRSSIINTERMQRIVTFVKAYYDRSIISGALPDGISISIQLLGFVQTRACRPCTNCEIFTMPFWFPASWALIRQRPNECPGSRKQGTCFLGTQSPPSFASGQLLVHHCSASRLSAIDGLTNHSFVTSCPLPCWQAAACSTPSISCASNSAAPGAPPLLLPFPAPLCVLAYIDE